MEAWHLYVYSSVFVSGGKDVIMLHAAEEQDKQTLMSKHKERVC